MGTKNRFASRLYFFLQHLAAPRLEELEGWLLWHYSMHKHTSQGNAGLGILVARKDPDNVWTTGRLKETAAPAISTPPLRAEYDA